MAWDALQAGRPTLQLRGRKSPLVDVLGTAITDVLQVMAW